uniref:Pulmonary surfactant-associated protein B n=1 Tax=Geotrypetes seraphini TaxID=260995 RepID=A0A6P8R479_GEOSA|nr:pulmonary surfactant-associated protein B [Geotrypetes seraphini]
MPAVGLAILSWICMSTVVTGKVLDQDKCRQGPEFWCQNIVTAIQCGELGHCIQTVWKKEEGGNLCGDCKQLVTTFINMIKDSSLQDGIKNFLHKECNLIPMKSTVLQCQLVVDKYMGTMMTFLENQINPDVICATLGLCLTDQSKHETRELVNHIKAWLPLWKEDSFGLPPDRQTMQADGLNVFPIPLPTCWLCRFLTGRVESAIPKDAIAKGVTKLCHLLPSKISGMCQCITEKYTVILMDTILSKIGAQYICGLIFLCATEDNYAPDTPMVPVPGKDIKCETCLTITAQAKASINENSSMIETEAVLHNICNTYHLDFPKCQKFMQQYQSDLLILLKKNWDNHTTCQEIGVCGAVASTALKAGDCTQGPAYWCSNMDAAKECKAVLHCQTHVWN